MDPFRGTLKVWLEWQKERKIADAKIQTLAEMKPNGQNILEALKILPETKEDGSEAMQALEDKCGGIMVALQKFHWSCLGGL